MLCSVRIRDDNFNLRDNGLLMVVFNLMQQHKVTPVAIVSRNGGDREVEAYVKDTFYAAYVALPMETKGRLVLNRRL